MEQTKHNCYTCKHRGNVPGDAHSTCNSSGLSDTEKIMLSSVVFNESLRGQTYGNIGFNLHGVSAGWCFWPSNFDPIWITKCKFYEQIPD